MHQHLEPPPMLPLDRVYKFLHPPLHQLQRQPPGPRQMDVAQQLHIQVSFHLLKVQQKNTLHHIPPW